MPQLDITTHFSQIFFTLLIFILFYGNLIQWVIPFINQSLKIRKKKIKYSTLNINNIYVLFIIIHFFKNLKFNNSFTIFFNKVNFYINHIETIKSNLHQIFNTDTNTKNLLKFYLLNLNK